MAVKPSYEELELRVKALEEDAIKGKQAEKALLESEDKYKRLIENANSIILRWDADGRIIYLNPYGLSYFKYTEDEIVGRHVVGTIVPWQETTGRNLGEMINNIIKNPMKYKNNLNQNMRSDGGLVWVSWTNEAILDDNGEFVEMLSIGNDITELVLAEQKLKLKEKQLQEQTRNLKEVNTAMKVLLKKRDEDKVELEEKLLINVKELIVNYLEKIKNTELDSRQRTYVELMESNLKEIVSPFLRRLSNQYNNLTPTEVWVAKLVRQGKTSKEISELVNLSPRTIEFHRDNIRGKMGIKNRKINLRTHLLSLG